MQRRGSVSLQASARTAPSLRKQWLRSKPNVSARALTQVTGLRKGMGAHRHNRETSRLLRRSATANFLRAVSLRA